MELGASRQARHREQPASRGDRIEARDGRGRKQAGGPPEASELMAGPSPVYASPSQPSGGWTVRVMGSPYLDAKSQSRWSWAGTAMMAPVP